jgi:hypothetical protein
MNKAMLRLLLFGILLGITHSVTAQSQKVEVVQQADGWRLLVDGKAMMVQGMNWDYFPVGTNYNYSIWNQSPSLIKDALDYEMSLLKNMGVNSIRVYTGIPKQWIEYIYDTHGIYTMLNHSFGRYGLTVDGVWKPNTEYADPKVKAILLDEVTELAEQYKDTRGLLLYLLGNENNYGLFWDGAETEDIPMADRKSTIRAREMYKLFNQGALAMKAIDANRPIAMANGDLLFLDIIAEEVPDIDIFGANVYRGVTFTDLYDRLKREYPKPVLLTEFGSDAFNVLTNQEDQLCQAYYNHGNWKEIYANAAGLGKNENAIGGYTFQFSDGWWKYGQTTNLSVHDNNASWSNGGYPCDYVEGQNNMNEEWFGIMAKGPTNERGLYKLYPRAAYYVLKQAHAFNPYAEGRTLEELETYFKNIDLTNAYLMARGDKAALQTERTNQIRLASFNAHFGTYSTGGALITTPKDADPTKRQYPNQLGFDHMQSFFFGVEAQPSASVRAQVEFNVLGNVPQNPIDEIFYENRGRPIEVKTTDGYANIEDLNRIQVYKASYNWDHRIFNLTGFYRTGHYHWGYEGDFFGLYPEANYGPNIDIYNAVAPFGFEASFKKQLDGLKVAFGPQLWWGANPAFLVKYSRNIRTIDLSAVYHEDLDRQATTQSSFAIPQPLTRRLSLHAQRKVGNLTIDVGGLWAGQPLNGREFQLIRYASNNEAQVYLDRIRTRDNWGGKVKLTYQKGLLNGYLQSSIMGLVANGGADQTQTFTGWRLKDSGIGNQYNALAGFTYTVGMLQVAPNFMWQKPIEGPIPSDVAAPARPRNILDDPFAVRTNRETVAAELLLTFDPTPATWMYEWDSDRIEDAEFALSLGIVYRHQPTTMDAAIGIFPDGRTTFAFPGATPAKDVWELNARVVSKPNRDLGFIALIYAGDAQANGSDQRMIRRYGSEVRAMFKHMKWSSHIRFNDWGPYDYHRDFNLTYPLQLMMDWSTTLTKPDWFDLPATRIGLRGTWRSLDQFSPRYTPIYSRTVAGTIVPNPTAVGFDQGNEWEVRSYVQISF